jgi:hypothetical protein
VLPRLHQQEGVPPEEIGNSGGKTFNYYINYNDDPYDNNNITILCSPYTPSSIKTRSDLL